jgi:hypothetical protein
MSGPQPQTSVFPRRSSDALYSSKRDYLDWLRQAALGAEGVEHDDGFFHAFEESDLTPIEKVLQETGQGSSEPPPGRLAWEKMGRVGVPASACHRTGRRWTGRLAMPSVATRRQGPGGFRFPDAGV